MKPSELEIAEFNLRAEQSRIEMLLSIARDAHNIAMDIPEPSLPERVRDGALTALLNSLYPPMQVVSEEE